MITIDGTMGEGGGQILRTSLGLSLVTGQPFQIENIRAGRPKPGLMRQHLTAVRAAVEVGNAEVSGDAIGSRKLTFAPGKIQPGQYEFAIGTAGSATLVLQTVLPALMTTEASSTITLKGGTHNPWSPPFDFLEKALVPVLQQMGPRISMKLVRPGFYPAGGGEFHVSIEGASNLTPLDLLERGEIQTQRARAIVARLPDSIAERELKIVAKKLGWPEDALLVERMDNSLGPGNILMLETVCDNVTEVHTAFGEKDLRAESVARKAVTEVRDYLASGVPVGQYMADQLLVPLALGGGRFRTMRLSRHSTTNLEVIKQFLGSKFSVEKIDRGVNELTAEC